MGVPIASPGDLSTYLGSAVDVGRAVLLLRLAQDLAEAVVTPLPAEAAAVVLSAAARGYANAQGVTAETVGPYSVQRPAAGVYLTKGERSALRRLAGGGGAFSVSVLSAEWRAP